MNAKHKIHDKFTYRMQRVLPLKHYWEVQNSTEKFKFRRTERKRGRDKKIFNFPATGRGLPFYSPQIGSSFYTLFGSTLAARDLNLAL